MPQAVYRQVVLPCWSSAGLVGPIPSDHPYALAAATEAPEAQTSLAGSVENQDYVGEDITLLPSEEYFEGRPAFSEIVRRLDTILEDEGVWAAVATSASEGESDREGATRLDQSSGGQSFHADDSAGPRLSHSAGSGVVLNRSVEPLYVGSVAATHSPHLPQPQPLQPMGGVPLEEQASDEDCHPYASFNVGAVHSRDATVASPSMQGTHHHSSSTTTDGVHPGDRQGPDAVHSLPTRDLHPISDVDVFGSTLGADAFARACDSTTPVGDHPDLTATRPITAGGGRIALNTDGHPLNSRRSPPVPPLHRSQASSPPLTGTVTPYSARVVPDPPSGVRTSGTPRIAPLTRPPRGTETAFVTADIDSTARSGGANPRSSSGRQLSPHGGALAQPSGTGERMTRNGDATTTNDSADQSMSVPPSVVEPYNVTVYPRGAAVLPQSPSSSPMSSSMEDVSRSQTDGAGAYSTPTRDWVRPRSGGRGRASTDEAEVQMYSGSDDGPSRVSLVRLLSPPAARAQRQVEATTGSSGHSATEESSAAEGGAVSPYQSVPAVRRDGV